LTASENIILKRVCKFYFDNYFCNIE